MISQDKLNETWRQSILLTFSLNQKVALRTATEIADEKVEALKDIAEARSIVIVLLREYMKINDNGQYPEAVRAIIDSNPRLKWATDKASVLHAGIACSPFYGGFDRFDKDIDATIAKGYGERA